MEIITMQSLKDLAYTVANKKIKKPTFLPWVAEQLQVDEQSLHRLAQTVMWVKNMSLGYVHTYNACSLVMLAYLTCRGEKQNCKSQNRLQQYTVSWSLYVSQLCITTDLWRHTHHFKNTVCLADTNKNALWKKKSHQHFPKQLQWVTTKHSFSITSPPSKLTLALKK